MYVVQHFHEPIAVKAWTELHFLHEVLLLFNKMYVVQHFHEPIVVKAWTEVHFLHEVLLLFNKIYVVQHFQLAHESVEQRTFCGKAVALHEENVLLSMLLQLLAHESVEQRTFC
jgi:hypothetical protein